MIHPDFDRLFTRLLSQEILQRVKDKLVTLKQKVTVSDQIRFTSCQFLGDSLCCNLDIIAVISNICQRAVPAPLLHP